MAAPDITLNPTNPLLTFPDLSAEAKRLPPIEKPESTARQTADSDQQASGEAEKSAKKDSKTVDPRGNRLVEQLGGKNSELSISMDKNSKKIVIKIVNSETKEVIRQIPPEELVQLAESLQASNGSLFDKTI